MHSSSIFVEFVFLAWDRGFGNLDLSLDSVCENPPRGQFPRLHGLIEGMNTILSILSKFLKCHVLIFVFVFRRIEGSPHLCGKVGEESQNLQSRLTSKLLPSSILLLFDSLIKTGCSDGTKHTYSIVWKTDTRFLTRCWGGIFLGGFVKEF